MPGPAHRPGADHHVQDLGRDEDGKQDRHPVAAPHGAERLAQGVRQAEAQQPEAPQQGGQQVLRQHARELDLEAQERARADLAPQLHRRPHVDAPGHRVALEPARALLDPRQRAAVRLFMGGEVRDLDPHPHAREADAQVRVLGHVPGVPRARPLQRVAAEELRGAAQRHDQPHARHAGQHRAEQRRVFDREAARQPVGARVVEVERALDAGHVRGRRRHVAGDLVELPRLWPVLGIPDADDVAAAEAQRVGQRAGLRLDRPVGHDDDAQPAGQGDAVERGAGDLVCLLDHQDDVAEFARIGEPRQPPDQLAGHVRLVEQRHHDRDQGQLSPQLRRRGFLQRPDPQRGAERHDLQRDAAHQRERRPQRQRRQKRERREQQPERQHQHQGQRDAARPRLVAGPAAEIAGNPRFRLPDQLRAPRGQDRVPRRGGGTEEHADRSEAAPERGCERRELIGAGRRDIGHPAGAPPGHDARVEAQSRPRRVDQPGVGRGGGKIRHGRAPLPRQGAGERAFAHPAMGQKDLAQRHVLALPHDDGLEKVAGRHRPVLDQDLAQRALVARGLRRCLRPCGRLGPVTVRARLAQARLQRDHLGGRRAVAGGRD